MLNFYPFKFMNRTIFYRKVNFNKLFAQFILFGHDNPTGKISAMFKTYTYFKKINFNPFKFMNRRIFYRKVSSNKLFA